MQALPAPLAPMAAREQFVTWYARPKPDKPGKYDKIPCDWRTGQPCDAHNPDNWCSAAVALCIAPTHDQGHGSGAGFVFTADDPFFFLDIDNALQPDGQWSPLAIELCARFAGAAVEVSHSGRGLHVFGTYVGDLAHGTRNTAAGLELYTSGRFVALTGSGAQGDAAHDCTALLGQVTAMWFPPSAVTVTVGDWTTEPCPEWRGPADDDELIRRFMASAARSLSALPAPGQTASTAPTLATLWRGECDPNRRSESDQTLANHLAWWTGRDCERIERLMRRSGLLREKWDAPGHANYLTNTILKACAVVTGCYAESASPAPPEIPARPVDAPTTPQPALRRTEYVGPNDQLTHFVGCTVISTGRDVLVYAATTNTLYTRPSFDVDYGGHVFPLDAGATKTTESAWLAFTQSRIIEPPRVQAFCFRADVPTGALVVEGGLRMVNTYAPYHPRLVTGDPSPFLNHLRLMLPDAGDREVLLMYAAHLAQRPGVKVMWWPVLQGAKGNGKTMLGEILEYLAGEAYSHRPNAAALAKDGMKFNTWLERKTLIVFDEVALGHRRDFLEELKPVVTGRRIQVEGKGADQRMMDNAANGIILTNHADGVPINSDERRYAVFYCAQQAASDLTRDGMTEEYFARLHGWLNGDGRAIIAQYLMTYPLPAELPSRAPMTTSRDTAIAMSRGRAEQEVQEAIEEQRPGFAGGWVSSRYLDALLGTIRAAVPRSKRRGLMQSLGYDYHPALPDGRATSIVTPDNARPKLYVRAGHLALNIVSPVAVGDAYSKAQTGGGQVVSGFSAPTR